MGRGKDVNEELETSWWDLWVDVANLSDEGVTCSNVVGQLWSFVNSDLVRCFGSCWILQALRNGLAPFLILQAGIHKGDMARRKFLDGRGARRGSSAATWRATCRKSSARRRRIARRSIVQRWQLRESEAWNDEVWIGGTWIGGTGSDDEKVSEDDGEEVNDFEEQISWLQHTLIVVEIVEKGRKEWNGEHEVVEDVREGQQGLKLEVDLELDESEKEGVPMPVGGDVWTPYRQRESERLPQQDPKVEVLEAR
eukprot:s2567_g3.t1